MAQLKKVIIPAAKIVPEELQEVGKLPGIIYPINQKIVFDYLYEEYKDQCSTIDIVCYENAETVRATLSKYLGRTVRLLMLDHLGDLGYSVYYALSEDDGTVIINFSDTIVLDTLSSEEGDAFFCKEDYMSDLWTYYDEHDGVITRIYDKRDIVPDVRKPLFVGVFQLSNGGFFKKCLEEAFAAENLKMSTLYYAFMLYSQKYPVKPIVSENWFDIGHKDNYFNSSLEVKAREFNHITIDKNRGILIKSSDDIEKFIGEIRWYLKLPTDIEYVRPRIFDYSTAYDNPYVSMEYYTYHTVHELYLFGNLGKQQWEDIFKRIRFICKDFKRYTVSNDDLLPSLEDMYLTKTLKRLENLRSDERFLKMFEKPVSVNGRMYLSMDEITGLLKKLIPETLYDVDTFHIIHGDLCFSNIMIDSNYSFVKVIDPRGKFGYYDIYGDTRYELAKLFHSVDGKYDFIIKDLFDVTFDLDAPRIDYSIQDRCRGFDLYRVFLEVFKDEIASDLKKIELIEALLFLSMIPLHNESLEHQAAMLGTGLDILNRVVDITVGGGRNHVQ